MALNTLMFSEDASRYIDIFFMFQRFVNAFICFIVFLRFMFFFQLQHLLLQNSCTEIKVVEIFFDSLVPYKARWVSTEQSVSHITD